jgi:hypothetical protein
MWMRRTLASMALTMAVGTAASATEGWSIPPPGYTFEPITACREDPVRAVKPVRPNGAVYALCDDQMQVLGAAIEKAGRERKLLIVTVGATWCPWCAALQGLMKGPEFFERTSDPIDWRGTFNHLEIGVSTLDKGRNAIVPSGVAVERHLRERSGGVEIRSIPFIIVLDPAQPNRVVARNSMDISNVATGKQDMARFREVIAEAHAELTGTKAAAR